MGFTAPTIANFEAQFIRDFPFSSDITVGVTPTDIVNAFNVVDMSINQGLWASQQQYTYAYLLLAAHYLVIAVRASSQGLNGQANWAQNSKAVGAVNEAFTIPEWIVRNPTFMGLSKTNYGMQYLQLALPNMSGQMFNAFGATQP